MKISIPISDIILRGVTIIDENLVELQTGHKHINYAVVKDSNGLLNITGLYEEDYENNSIIIDTKFTDLINKGELKYFEAYSLTEIELDVCSVVRRGLRKVNNMENNTQVNVTKIASFSTANNLDDAISLGYNILDEIFKPNPNASKIVVSVSVTDDGGSYSHSDVFVYDSYANALDKINSLEYSHNTAVEVIEANVRGFSLILNKCFDGTGYSRLAQVHFNYWDHFKARQLWDVEADIYTVTYEQYE